MGQKFSKDSVKFLDALQHTDEQKMTKYKEANKTRIKNGQVEYSNKLRAFLITCIHPLQNESHTLSRLCIIHTEQIAYKTDNAIKQ